MNDSCMCWDWVYRGSEYVKECGDCYPGQYGSISGMTFDGVILVVVWITFLAIIGLIIHRRQNGIKT
jgi:hypothetical protein